MTTEQIQVRQPKGGVTRSTSKISIERGYINRSVLNDMRECLLISQCCGAGRFRNTRLFNRVVVEYNRHMPGFAKWLRAAGVLKNLHTPGKKLTQSHRVYQKADGRYYCFPATQFYMFLLANLYREQIEEFENNLKVETK